MYEGFFRAFENVCEVVKQEFTLPRTKKKKGAKMRRYGMGNNGHTLPPDPSVLRVHVVGRMIYICTKKQAHMKPGGSQKKERDAGHGMLQTKRLFEMQIRDGSRTIHSVHTPCFFLFFLPRYG